MYGELQELNITEELVRKVAEEQFRSFDDFRELSDQKGWVQTDWKIGANKDLCSFNHVVECLKNIKHECEVRVHCCDFHDVDEFYKD